MNNEEMCKCSRCGEEISIHETEAIEETEIIDGLEKTIFINYICQSCKDYHMRD
jgi:hypothetical protein